MHRPFALALVVVLAACGSKKSKEAPIAASFAPTDSDAVVLLDLTKARSWPAWAAAAPQVFKSVQPAIDAVKTQCEIDLLADASWILLARRGVGPASDVTLGIGGLPRDKTGSCAVKIGERIPGLKLTAHGDQFQVLRDDKSFAAGAILASGDVVIVSRAGGAPAPAAWSSEVEGERRPPPAWWAELDQQQPLAIRTQRPEHTITASAQLGDPLVVRGKVVTASAQSAQVELARLKAILDFLTRAGAGTGRLEPRDNVIHGDFTATGKEIDALVAAALSAIGAEPPPTGASGVNTTPIACTELRGAVAAYLLASLQRMSDDERGMVVPTIERLKKNLGDAYVDTCTLDGWAPEIIHCHVDNAQKVSRFEKCRMMVAEEPRKKFDERVKAALEASR
jgi:hypothetical protein